MPPNRPPGGPPDSWQVPDRGAADAAEPSGRPAGRRRVPDRAAAAAAPEELRAEVEAAISGRLLATIDELGEDAVLWLASPPLWTLGAAEAAGFPARPVIDFVRRARDAGWCKARGPLLDTAPSDLVFWMPDEVRRAVIDVLRGRLGGERVMEVGAGVARLVGDLAGHGTLDPTAELPDDQLPDDGLPGALVAWTALMTSPLLPATWESSGWPRRRPPGRPAYPDHGAFLIAWTQQAVADRDLGRAQDLVAAGEAIAGVLGGSTEQALSRARRLLALGLRRRQDERALVRYLDRPELSDAMARLLDRDPSSAGASAAARATAGESPAGAAPAAEPPWALHLRGVGGVGKTMLIRYLASGRYAADRNMAPIPVARADFDRINPDYPVRRPVQLLLELADELALHAAASDRADQALTVFRARAARAHEAVSGLREAGGSPLRNPEVALAVDRFGDVLAEMGSVLLILDTCEELAKADLDNPAAPAVRATLDIIERLHKRAPTARVLFAGRRPLPERPYLAVQPVAGFTVDEARRYLTASASRPLPADLTEEMIRQSAAVDGPVPAAGQLPARVSPFDLALYAAWADEDPGLDVAQVSRGSDAYVEGRIVERLDDPLVVRALPVLAAAGRCRVATIAALLDCDPDLLSRRLAEQEWIDADGEQVPHVAARPTLASRLRRYFESDERHAEFAVRTAALASALLDQARQASLAEIDADELLAALRLAEPAAAAALWDSIADRATRPPGRWGTVLNLTRRVLGEWDEEEWPTTAALRATVTASHIAASRRDSPLFDASGPWETVRAWAERHPDPAAQRRLLDRAVLGLLPYTPDDESLWRVVDAFSPSRTGAGAPSVHPGELMAAFADAAHRLIEAGRDGAFRHLYRVLLEIARHTGWPDPRTEAWIEVARARLLVDDDSGAWVWPLERAERLVAGATGDEPSWPDWIPPDDLLARIRIERGLIAPPEDLTVLDAWESCAADRMDTIDGERLASLCLRIRLRHGIIDAAVAERWEATDSYSPDRVPAGSAHDLVPPLFVSVAQAWMSAGEPGQALALLDRRRRAALGTRQDDLTVRHADAATVAIDRRLRLTDRQSLLTRLASERGSGDPGPTALGDTQALAWRALALVSPGSYIGPLPSLQATPQRWHAWWQSCGPLVLPDSAKDPSARPSSPTSADVADIQADLAESRQARPRWQSDLQISLSWQLVLTDWLEHLPPPPPPPARSAEPHRELRAAMRQAALAGEAFDIPTQVPPRLLAEMAFEEAELTAPRLPEAASPLFRTAAVAYRMAGDPLGESLARLSVLLTAHPDGGLPAARPGAAAALADEALNALARLMPEVFATLSGRQPETGPWRNWTPAGRTETGWAKAVREAAELTAAGPAAGGTVATAPAPPATESAPFAQVRPGASPAGQAQPGASPAAQVQPGALFAGPRAAGASPPAPGSLAAARRAERSGRLPIAVAVLAACLVGLGALGVFTLLSVGTHPGEKANPTSSVIISVSQVATSQPVTTPASTAAASTTAASSQATPGSGESPVPWIVALIAGLAALAGLLGWYVPKIIRLARGRGVGAARLGTLVFDVDLIDLPMHRLQVRPRPWRTTPPRLRAARWLVSPASWLDSGSPRAGSGYVGLWDTLSPSVVPRWRAPLPVARAVWWHRGRGTALGVIHGLGDHFDSLELILQPCERILVASLSPDAAGRIEWLRLVATPLSLAFAAPQLESRLVAPPSWARALSQHYTQSARFSTGWADGRPVSGLLHVIGRAVATSAGPAMDLGAEATAESGAQQLLYSVTELKQPAPAMVILQAEPAPGDAIDAGPPDDQAEKLRLGAALAADGVPAVLLLPVFPAGIMDELARIITTHVGRQQGAGAQVLLTRVRAAVTSHVAPPVLDDIVLFLNVARYQS